MGIPRITLPTATPKSRVEPYPAPSGVASQRASNCRASRAVAEAEMQAARYVLTAHASTWTELLSGSLDPVVAVMSGRLELAKGSAMALFPHIAAAKELVAAAKSLQTTFPVGWLKA